MKTELFNQTFEEKMLFVGKPNVGSYPCLWASMYPVSKALDEGAKSEGKVVVRLVVFDSDGKNIVDVLEQDWPHVEGCDPDLGFAQHIYRGAAETFESNDDMDTIMSSYDLCELDALETHTIKLQLQVFKKDAS